MNTGLSPDFHVRSPEEVTLDRLESFGFTVIQPRRGYRFSVDALLLADFARFRRRDMVMELGTGCGIIAMIIAARHPSIRVTGIEIQARLAEIARENVRLNGLEEQIDILEGNIDRIRDFFRAGSFDHVVSNPPFRNPDAGRLCINSQEAVARHEIFTDMSRILSAARYLLHPGGRVSLIYSAERAASALARMHLNRLEPKRLRMIHPTHGEPARMFLVEGCRDAGEEISIETPVFLDRWKGLSRRKS